MHQKTVFNRAVSALVRSWERDFWSKLYILWIVYIAATSLWCTSIAVEGHWRYWTGELESEEPRALASQLVIEETWAAYERASGTERAIRFLRPLAESGDPEAQYLLGYHLLWHTDPLGGRRKCEAMTWFDRAARGGHPSGQQMLASAYRDGGYGLYKNFEKAYRWALAAARNGSTDDRVLRSAVEDLTAAERQAIERDMETWRPEDEPPALIICLPDFPMGGGSLIGPKSSYSYF